MFSAIQLILRNLCIESNQSNIRKIKKQEKEQRKKIHTNVFSCSAGFSAVNWIYNSAFVYFAEYTYQSFLLTKVFSMLLDFVFLRVFFACSLIFLVLAIAVVMALCLPHANIMQTNRRRQIKIKIPFPYCITSTYIHKKKAKMFKLIEIYLTWNYIK
ncbi:hypothetical protein LguiA_017541 [Lonicera macranthoides]